MESDSKNLVPCLFGHHDIIKLPANKEVQICLRCGYCISGTGTTFWAHFDPTGMRLLYRKFDNGDEEWYKYDDKNRLIHFRKSDGFNVEYDYNGNRIPKSKTYVGPNVKFTENPLNIPVKTK